MDKGKEVTAEPTGKGSDDLQDAARPLEDLGHMRVLAAVRLEGSQGVAQACRVDLPGAQTFHGGRFAVFVGGEVEFCAALSLTVVAISTAQPTAKRKIRLMLCLRHRPNRGVVNNRDFFYLPSTGAPVIPGSS